MRKGQEEKARAVAVKKEAAEKDGTADYPKPKRFTMHKKGHKTEEETSAVRWRR